jgi:hypothetical protein
MTGNKKSDPTSAADGRAVRPQATSYDMFEGLEQTRLKAAEANRKRLLAGSAPAAPPASKE